MVLLEAVMLEDIKADLRTLDFRGLTPSQWADLKRRLVERAHDERNQMIRETISAISCWLGRTLVAVEDRAARFTAQVLFVIAREWRSLLLAYRRRVAVAQLGALDDRMLRDIGLRRSEIVSAVYRLNHARRR
jgi:uncharacterized protein YjiS (DUF1127 family)